MENIVYNLDYYEECLSSWTKENFTIKIGGATSCFRCTSCGSIVFKKRKDNPLKYKCNGCDATYTGEI